MPGDNSNPSTPEHAPAFRRWNGNAWLDVEASEWRRLASRFEKSDRIAPEAPASEFESEHLSQSVDYGKKGGRTGRALEKRQIRVDPKFMPRGHRGDTWTHLSGSPKGWGHADIIAALRASYRALRKIGLPVRANCVWCYRENGQWWALADRDGSLQSMHPPTAPDEQGSNFFALYYRSGPIDVLATVLPNFLDDYGGHGGAFEWAWQVRSIIVELRAGAQSSRKQASWLRQLTELPEWASLKSAAAATGAPGLEPGNLFYVLEKVATSGGREAVERPFIEGFQLGQALGALDVMRAVAQNEQARQSPRKDKKNKQRAMLREAEVKWPGQSAQNLAYLIKNEIDGKTQFGRRAIDAELGRSEKHVARLIGTYRKLPPHA